MATVSGSVSGTLYIIVNPVGPAVFSVSNITLTGAGSGQASVFPTPASTLNVGTHSSTITVTACVNDPTCATGQLVGSPQTVNVTYTIQSAVQGDVIAPRVVTAGEPGDVIIRGRGFSQASDVRFGNAQATTFTVVNDTEIRARYPALAAGKHAVVIDSGAVPFSGALAAVDPVVYAAADLTYPTPPEDVGGILYDAERRALFVTVRHSQVHNGAGDLLRYSFDGSGWETPVAVSVPGIRDIAFSPDGTKLIAVTDGALVEVDPAALTLGGTHTPVDSKVNGGFAYLSHIAFANDGYGILTTGVLGSGMTELHLYSSASHAFYSIDDLVSFGNPGVSGDGSLGLVVEGGVTPAQPIYQYQASPQIYWPTSIEFSQHRNPRFGRVTLNRSGSRFVVPGHVTTVYDDGYHALGTLANTTRSAVLRPDGTRVYAYDSASELRTYDLTAAPVPGEFPITGAAVVPTVHGTTDAVAMTITPDGGTVFIAGALRALVRPIP